MQKDSFYILPEDRQYATARIAELETEIQNMGPDFYEALTQSNETWHDNAPFDALREKQSVLAAELQSLRETLRSASISLPKPRKNTVGIGSLVKLSNDGGKEFIYRIAGDWTANAGQNVSGVTIVSSRSPVAQVLLGKKLGLEVKLPPRDKLFTITDITN